MKIFNIIIYTFTLIFFAGCGFKLLDQTKLKNYNILEIKDSGDKRVNFFIKNELNNLLNDANSNNDLIVTIKTEKVKSIKEKNKKNQITKYNININSIIEIYFINRNVTKTINLNKENFYNVNTNQSVTRNNQKNIENNLNDKLAQDISNKLLRIINEL
jgi:outer membrane lipopolysaccharide assembly protein LptE/RlpB